MFYHLGGEKTTGRGEEGSPLVSGARSTRGRRLPSLDARSGDHPQRPCLEKGICGGGNSTAHHLEFHPSAS